MSKARGGAVSPAGSVKRDAESCAMRDLREYNLQLTSYGIESNLKL
jgi:hypothetical protein